MKTERLLQFIWQFQYFNKGELKTADGETITILAPGVWNLHQGPDFINARIRVGDTLWAGNVELHICASDWDKHRHTDDRNYDNVILHVVWQNDLAGWQGRFPVIELKDRIPSMLLKRYEELMNTSSFIPCEKSIHYVRQLTWKSWKDRLLAERLLRKTVTVHQYLEETNHHWEEVFWWMLARNFGIRVNSGAFEAIARSIPLSILAKHKHHPVQVEAMLMGQAGLLKGRFADEYPILLQREYAFIQKKYRLRPVHEQVHFLRMRPFGFPTIRLAQLAALICRSSHLFTSIKETASADELFRLFMVPAGEYWDTHYRFDKTSAAKKKQPGGDMIDTIVINTIAPVLFAYGHYHNEESYKDKALEWLEQTAAEKNAITGGFEKSGIYAEHAFDSQALIELHNEYCKQKRCLDCGVGNSLLKPKKR